MTQPNENTPTLQELQTLAEQGDSGAQFCLANLYEHSELIAQDLEKAKYWYTKAAEQGDEDAKEALAEMEKGEE